MKQPTIHRNWFRPHQAHSVDKTGVAVALAFLLGILLLAGGRGDKTPDITNGPPGGAAKQADIAPAATLSFETAVVRTTPTGTQVREDGPRHRSTR